MSKGAFSKATVELAFEREQSCCARCGRGVDWNERGWGWSAQHREARGMGSSRLPHVSAVSNALILCGTGTQGCHSIVETFRLTALELGYAVSRHGLKRPLDVPVRHAVHGWVFLNDDGSITAAEGSE